VTDYTTRLEIRLRELECLVGELTVINRTLKKIIELLIKISLISWF